jgi:hypothetical protein
MRAAHCEISRSLVELTRWAQKAIFGAWNGLISEGYHYLSAAGQMGIALNTVRNHIRSIYDKLHVHEIGTSQQGTSCWFT